MSFAVSIIAAAGLWIMGVGRPGHVYLLLFLVAVGLFAIRPLRNALGADAPRLAPCLPVLAPFIQGGAAGLALAAFLAGFGVLLVGPCLGMLSPRKGLYYERRILRRWTRGPVAARLLVSLALLISYGAVAYFSPFPPVFCLVALGLFLVIYVISLWASMAGSSSMRIRRHRRFSPVRMIVSRRAFELGFAWAMLPFAFAALVLAFLDFVSIVDMYDGGGTLPGLFAALVPLLFILPAFILWGSAGKQEEYGEAPVAFFSRNEE